MAEHGAQVLVLESETTFKDRVRGEAMVSWGVNEAKSWGYIPTSGMQGMGRGIP